MRERAENGGGPYATCKQKLEKRQNVIGMAVMIVKELKRGSEGGTIHEEAEG